VSFGLGTRLANLDSMTKVVAARDAQPIPVWTEYVITIFALQEHRLPSAELLRVGQGKVSP